MRKLTWATMPAGIDTIYLNFRNRIVINASYANVKYGIPTVMWRAAYG